MFTLPRLLPIHRRVALLLLRGRTPAVIANTTGWQQDYIDSCLADLKTAASGRPLLYTAIDELAPVTLRELVKKVSTTGYRNELRTSGLEYAAQLATRPLPKRHQFATLSGRWLPEKSLYLALQQARAWGLATAEINELYGKHRRLQIHLAHYGFQIGEKTPLEEALQYVDSNMSPEEHRWLKAIPLVVRTKCSTSQKVSEHDFLTAWLSPKGRTRGLQGIASMLGASDRTIFRLRNYIAQRAGIPPHGALLPVVYYIRSKPS